MNLTEVPLSFCERMTFLASQRFGFAKGQAYLVDDKFAYQQDSSGEEPILRQEHPAGTVVSRREMVCGRWGDLCDGNLPDGYANYVAGVPLKLPSGCVVGALCIYNHEELPVTADDFQWLATLVAAAYDFQIQAEDLQETGARLGEDIETVTTQTDLFRRTLLRKEAA